MSRRGFTLVELIVTIAIFTVIIAIPLAFLIRELKNTVKEANLSQVSIENVAFSSLIRKDIELAGYGIPWDVRGVTYSDTTAPVPEYSLNLSLFNTAPPVSPKPVDGARDTGSNGFSYLVLRGTVLGLSRACDHWTYINSNGDVNIWPDNTSKAYNNFEAGDRAIVLNAVNRRIIPSSTGNFYFTILNDFTETNVSPSYYGLPDGLPASTYLVYGVSYGVNPSFPYNRVDYYLHRPSVMPKNCAGGTYLLYRNASYPILSCVADFQVGFGLDTTGDGVIDTWTQSLLGYTATQIRDELKQVRVYILIQNGVYDKNYTYPGTSVFVGDSSLGIGRSFNFAGITNYKHYRWKLIKLTVIPKNLGESK